MVLVYHMIEKPDALLINLKKSLKPGSSLVILDPRDEMIDREFGIDRSKPGVTTPVIKERIQKSALNAGYEIVKTDTILPLDYIFILKPLSPAQKKSAAMLIQKTLAKDGIDASVTLFNKIKKEPDQYDLSEKVFAILGNEYIGARSYPEAVAVLNMGIELYPQSSQLYGTIGEVYLLLGDKENARKNYRLFLENGPDSLNANTLMQNFDMMYEQMRQMNQ
jgi:tetratricopeptide (TPR) repeat protein